MLFLLFLFLSACQNVPQSKSKKTALSSPLKNLDFSITLAFVGDVIIHERIRKREDKTNEGYESIWSGIQKYLETADLTYANLEGPVAPEYGGVSGFPLFNFPEEIIPALKNSGFDVVSNANNHALDRHAEGVRKTIANLKKYALGHTGTLSNAIAYDLDEETWWYLTSIKSKFVAWLSCTEMTNGIHDRENQVLYCFKDIEKVKELVKKLKLNKDIVAIILLPHWGEEEKFEIESYRRRWAHIMLNFGGTAVIGSHPHVPQKIEPYTTTDGRLTYIAYSLGNFISNQPWIPNKTSMLLYLKLKIIGDSASAIIEDLKYVPLWMNRSIDKNGTSKFRLEAAFNLKKYPLEAVKIWSDQLPEEKRLNAPGDVDLFLEKQR